MTYHKNVYDNPEKFGLEIVGVLGDPDLMYEYEMLVVFKDKDNNIYYVDDGGDSGQSPFEDYDKLSDLNILTPEKWNKFQEYVTTFANPTFQYRGYTEEKAQKELAKVLAKPQWQEFAAEKTELLAKVSKLLNG